MFEMVGFFPRSLVLLRCNALTAIKTKYGCVLCGEIRQPLSQGSMGHHGQANWRSTNSDYRDTVRSENGAYCTVNTRQLKARHERPT